MVNLADGCAATPDHVVAHLLTHPLAVGYRQECIFKYSICCRLSLPSKLWEGEMTFILLDKLLPRSHLKFDLAVRFIPSSDLSKFRR